MGEKGGGTLFALSNHDIFTVKNKTWRYCYYNNMLLLLINNINVFKHVCVSVAACVHIYKDNIFFLEVGH